MTPRRILTGCVITLAAGSLLLWAITPGSAQKMQRIAHGIDVSEPATITAVLPDVSAFVAALREGEAMRAFFDSPLGLHFLRSAPLRGAAHLHRFISLAPRSWQWNLYTLITNGPVFYRSHGKQFVLVIRLNAKGKVITSILKDANATKVDEWFVIASDKETLAAAAKYLSNPAEKDSPLDAQLKNSTSLSFLFRTIDDSAKKPSLTRALARQFFDSGTDATCTVSVTPAGNALGIQGDCAGKNIPKPAAPIATESSGIANYPAYAYFRKPGAKSAHVLAFSGFEAEYGYLIPHIMYSGPATDQKSIEFLSQAFKTKSHLVSNEAGALQIRYPHAYAYREKKYDIFAPHLAANREKFVWHSFLKAGNLGEAQLALNTEYQAYIALNPHQLVKNSEAAIKQFDPIYSPGHFGEFRDALFKSLPSLKKSALTIYTKNFGTSLKIGGSFQFAEK